MLVPTERLTESSSGISQNYVFEKSAKETVLAPETSLSYFVIALRSLTLIYFVCLLLLLLFLFVVFRVLSSIVC